MPPACPLHTPARLTHPASLLQMLTLLVLALSLLEGLTHGVPTSVLERVGIVGGNVAPRSKWPWQVSLRLYTGYYWIHWCGGSLVHPQWVLTAGQCIGRERKYPSQFMVQLGEQHLYYHEQLLPISRIIVHPNFSFVEQGADIALLELQDPVNTSSHVKLVTLPPATQTFLQGTMCWVTGWGDVNYWQSLPPPYPLQQVNVPIVENSLCDANYHNGSYTGDKIRIVHDDMICAGTEGLGPCKRDSGGPLVCKVNGTWMQAGVFSWGEACAQPNRPGIYTRVTYYLDWIYRYVPTEP
ncbi:tryptase alpha/beta-1-like [Rhynchocyon petersi]